MNVDVADGGLTYAHLELESFPHIVNFLGLIIFYSLELPVNRANIQLFLKIQTEWMKKFIHNFQKLCADK